MKKKHRQPAQKKRYMIKLALILAGFAMAFLATDMYLRPPIEGMASHHAQVYAMRCINDAVTAELGRQGVLYADIVSVKLNENGDVSSIQSDMLAINTLKTHVTDMIIGELVKEENQQLQMPLGTLIGNHFTAGRGPEIKIRLIPVGYVQTGIYNQFISAGINQTLHRIMLEASVQMLVIIPGYRIETETVTSFCIAETVIVGGIPEAYTYIDGDESPIISKINDYGAAA